MAKVYNVIVYNEKFFFCLYIGHERSLYHRQFCAVLFNFIFLKNFENIYFKIGTWWTYCFMKIKVNINQTSIFGRFWI